MRCTDIGSYILALILSTAAASADGMDFQSLQALIEHDRIDAIEQLLEALPSDYRSHYVLIFSSRSPKKGSMRDPRVILYGTDARFILSFNGNPAEEGYQDLETAEFDAQQDRFLFREVHFSTTGKSAARVEYSPINPVECLSCHGTPARPVWDTSPLWPGAYGERYGSNLSAVERAGIREFLRQQPTHPRYRTLIGTERFAYRSTFVPDARSEYMGDAPEPPNAEFTQLLNALNMRVIAAEVTRHARYAAYRYALLGVAEGNCGAPEEFLPPSLRASVRGDLRRFRETIDVADRRQNELKRQRALASTGAASTTNGPAEATSTSANFLYLVESGLGIQTREWTLAQEKGTYDFATPRGDGMELAHTLRANLAIGDPKINELWQAREGAAEDAYCRYLRESSQSVLATATDVKMRPLASLGPAEAAGRAPSR